MTLRQALSSDTKSIQSLLSQLGYPDFQEKDVDNKILLHKQEGYHMLVAEEGSKVAGFIALHWFDLAHWHGKLGRISAFCIDEEYRGRGIGQKMLQAAENMMLVKGCIKIEVTSNMKRTGAHAFYLKAGYVEDSRRFVKYRL